MRIAEDFFTRLAALQERRALTIVVVGFFVAALALPLVLRLGLDSSWEALLPESKPSVQDLELIGQRVGGLNTMTVAIESADTDALKRFAEELIPRLEELPSDLVRAVDWNVSIYGDFVWEHRHLYASLEDLREVAEKVSARRRWEHNRRNPLYVALDDAEEEPPDLRETLERIEEEAERRRSRSARDTGGFYLHPDGDLLAIFLRSDLAGSNAARIHELMERMDVIVTELEPGAYAPDLRVSYAGNLLLSLEEQEALAQELLLALILAAIGILLVVLIYFRSLRVVPLLALGLGVPVVVTFAWAWWSVGKLNTSTAFLGAIVVGNGINPNIIWLARYMEERRRQGAAVGEAILRAHRGTWLATLTASTAAGLAYGSLIITEFRGFRDFGVIGSVGMILCWLGAILLLPALAALSERIRPLRPQAALAGSREPIYGAFFSRIAHARPRLVVALSLVTGVLSVGLIAWALQGEPLEYDFRNLSSVREGSTDARRINDRVGEMVGSSMQGNGIAMVVDSPEEAAWLEASLEARAAMEERPLWSRVHSIFDFLPDEQEDKIEVLEDIREDLERMRRRASAEDRALIDEHMPPEILHRIGIPDLPETVARPFSERDGTRGTIIVVEKSDEDSVWDGRYLVEWAEALREARLPDGTRPPLAGRGPVFADMVALIWTSGPLAIGASFLATLLLVAFAFRRAFLRLFTMLVLLLGIAWMGGAMVLGAIKLNFLNFVAFPITFGNGVDYGVNVARRYAEEEGTPEAVHRTLIQSGGAVILCSLTTIIGYSSLYTSANRALNSFGTVMAISEVTCLIAATLTLPALLVLRERRRVREVAGNAPASGRGGDVSMGAS